MHSFVGDAAASYRPLNFPSLYTISDGRVVEHVDSYEVVAFKFASGRDCARARTSPLDRGNLISLIQLFLSSRFSFFPLSQKRKRDSATPSCRSPVPLCFHTPSFSSLHSFLAGLLNRPSQVRPTDLETSTAVRSGISSCGAMKLFNPSIPPRLAPLRKISAFVI